MGMTDDFELAIEEGATIVRVGRAIFGERPHEHAPDEPAHTHDQAAVGRPPRRHCRAGRAGGLVDSRRPQPPRHRRGRDIRTSFLSHPDVRFAVRLTPRAAVDHVDGVGRRRAQGQGRRARGRGRREPRAGPAAGRRARASPGARSGSWPAPPAARSWSSSTASTPRRSLPAGRACGYDRGSSGALRGSRPRAIGSVVRAHGSHPWGHWFESSIAHQSHLTEAGPQGPASVCPTNLAPN